jgi:hypothetical protein
MESQIAYWLTNGKTNIRLGNFAYSISEARREIDDLATPLGELCADLWTIQTQSPRNFTRYYCVLMFRMKYFVSRIGSNFR